MNNYERIKTMTIKEMIKLLANTTNYCNYCAYKNSKCDYRCSYGIKKWLLEECE